MPRKDRSFHGGDMIRLASKNLSNRETDDVILFYYMIVPEIAWDRIEARILGNGSIQGPTIARPTFISIFLLVIRVGRRINGYLTTSVRRWIITRLMSPEARKEVEKAMSRLEKPLQLRARG